MGVIIRQSLKATVVNYIGAFIGFITTMFIVTRFLSPEEVGLINLMRETAAILSGFMALGISQSVIRFYPYFKTDQGHENGFFFYVLIIPLIGCVFFSFLFFLLKNQIIAYFAENSPLFNQYFNQLIPLAIALAFILACESYANVKMRIAVPKLFKEVVLRLLYVLVILLYYFQILDLTQFVIAFVLTYMLVLLLNIFYVFSLGNNSFKHNFKEIPKSVKRDFIRYTLFVLTLAIGGSVVTRIDVFMVGGELGLEYSGIYGIAMYMAVIIEIPTRSIVAISAPVVSDSLKNNDMAKVQELFRKVSLNQLLLGAVLAVLVFINLDAIYQFIPNGEIYGQGKYVVVFILLAKLFDCVGTFSSVILSYSKYYYFSMFYMFFLAAITIILNRLLIPIYGISGAALATCVTFFLSNSVMLILLRTVLKVHPFSIGMLKILLITAVLLTVNFLLPEWNISYIADAVYRSLIIAALAFLCVYGWKVSPDFNQTVNTLLKKVLKRS